MAVPKRKWNMTITKKMLTVSKQKLKWSISCHCLPVYWRWIYFRTIVVDKNKNTQIVAVCLYAVNSIAHINEMQCTFRETGYTHMECDGMHATIEHAKKYAKVHSIGQWKWVLTTARRNSYAVLQDCSTRTCMIWRLVTATNSNNSVDNDGQPVNWCKVPSLCFQCNSDWSPSNSAAFRYNVQDEYRHIHLTTCDEAIPHVIVSAAPKAAPRKSTRWRKSTQIESATADNVLYSGSASIVAFQSKYTCQIPISKLDKRTRWTYPRQRWLTRTIALGMKLYRLLLESWTNCHYLTLIIKL